MLRFRTVSIALSFAVFSLLCWAGKNFVMPTPRAASTYPAHDAHPNERVTLALDPYDMPDKAKVFSVKYDEIGFMPIFMVITNDGDQPVSLASMNAQLVTVDRTKIDPAEEEDIYRRLAHPSHDVTSSRLPFPRSKVKGTVGKEAREEIRDSRFFARAVEPHSTQAGFLFFDVSGISTPLAGARFYLTGVRDAKGHDLMYFEVPLEKYLSAPTN
jgi:hypothetical protein